MPLTITNEHFVRQTDPERARALFKATVKLVEIETFSYCNRVCWFCPNSHIDRRSTNVMMDEDLYLGIMRDLGGIDYAGTIAYSRYNEPLADRVILTRVAQARAALPNAWLMTHTNGDYLDKEYLYALRDAGMNELKVQVYLGANDRFDDRAVLTRMSRRLNDLDLPYEFTTLRPGAYYDATVRAKGIKVVFQAYNYDEMAGDRGQAVELRGAPFRRTSPCFIVYENMYIDVDGTVMPCCNVRSDEPKHRDYVIDKITPERSIFAAYAASKLADWRRSLLTFGEKQAPCATCSYALVPESAQVRAVTEKIAEGLRELA